MRLDKKKHKNIGANSAKLDKKKLMGRTIILESRPLPECPGWTLQLKAVVCGKPGCKKCPHYAYWYAYKKVAGKTRCVYVGKDVEKARDRIVFAGKKCMLVIY